MAGTKKVEEKAVKDVWLVLHSLSRSGRVTWICMSADIS